MPNHGGVAMILIKANGFQMQREVILMEKSNETKLEIQLVSDEAMVENGCGPETCPVCAPNACGPCTP